MQLKKRKVTSKQLVKPQLTIAELLCHREGVEEAHPVGQRPEARNGSAPAAPEPATHAGWWEAEAKPRYNMSLLSSLVRSAATFTAFQVFLNHLQKQD